MPGEIEASTFLVTHSWAACCIRHPAHPATFTVTSFSIPV